MNYLHITWFIICFLLLANIVTAVEYQRPPFELNGKLVIPEEYSSQRDVLLFMFEGAWSGLKINVYKGYFSGYYRFVQPNDENHITLLTVSGEYDRGYLKGTWEYHDTNPFEDDNHGPYPQVYEGSGTFVSGLIESKTTEKIPANIAGTITYSHGDFDPKSTPTNVIWVNEVKSLTFNARWEGKLQGTVCGGPDLDQYVGKAIETGKINKDYSGGKAQIMHCGLADGSSPVTWQAVKDGEKIYVSDLLAYSSRGVTSLEAYHPDTLKELEPGEYAAGYSYSFGGTFSGPGENPGSGVISFLYPPPRETKLGLVMGRLWTNTKSLLINGTMKMETSQAAASIKGTNFIIGSNDPRITELMVLEGKVEFTSKADGKTIMVNAGQKAVATDEGLGEVTTFDPAPLLAVYKDIADTPQQPVEEDYTAGPAPEGAPKGTSADKSIDKGTSNNNIIIYVLIIAVLLSAGFFILKKKGKK